MRQLPELMEQVKEFLTDHKDGSFMICQALRAGVWQWFAKISWQHVNANGTKAPLQAIRYDGDLESAVAFVMGQYEELTNKAA